MLCDPAAEVAQAYERMGRRLSHEHAERIAPTCATSRGQVRDAPVRSRGLGLHRGPPRVDLAPDIAHFGVALEG